MSIFSYFFTRQLFETRSKCNGRIRVTEFFGRRELLVDGIQQTGRYTESLFETGIRTLRTWHTGDLSRVLVFGIGGGGIFHRLAREFPGLHMIGVDVDPAMIRIANTFFSLDTVPLLSLHASDARDFIRTAVRKRESYDCVIADIYTGNDVPDFAVSDAFFSSVCRVLRPQGSFMMNYFCFAGQSRKSEDIRTRLTDIFSRVKMEKNHRNIFFYGRK